MHSNNTISSYIILSIQHADTTLRLEDMLDVLMMNLEKSYPKRRSRDIKILQKIQCTVKNIPKKQYLK